MARILLCDGLEPGAVHALEALGHETVDRHYSPEELPARIGDFDAAVVRSATKITREVLDGALAGGRLRLIVRAGVGIDNIDADYARLHGIAVENTPAASSRAVAELAVAHMFALARFLYASNVTMREGKWNKKQYEGTELLGKTLGLVGFGRIGQQTAQIAGAIGMKVCYFTRSGRKEGFDACEALPMDELLPCADFLSLHVPYDRERGALIGDREFARMKDGVFLVNCARGGVVDEEALLRALDSGKVAAAALDVFSQEPPKNERLLRHERVSLSPHIGASTVEAQQRIGEEVVEILRAKL